MVADPTSAHDRVAILISVHRAADVTHFELALQSLRDQTYREIETWLFVDGPVLPGHEAAIERHFQAMPGGRVLRSAVSVGLPAALNRLIDDALGTASITLLARMDADDVCMPKRLQRQVETMLTRADIDVLGTWCIEFTEPDIPTFHKQLPVDPEAVRDFMIYRSPLAHPTVMFRRHVLDAGHRYNPSYLQMQDYELWARLVVAGVRIGNVPEYLLWFRMAENFFFRRTGWQRAWREAHLRYRYAKQAHLLRPLHLLGLFTLLLVRIAPVWLKRFAYRKLR